MGVPCNDCCLGFGKGCPGCGMKGRLEGIRSGTREANRGALGTGLGDAGSWDRAGDRTKHWPFSAHLLTTAASGPEPGVSWSHPLPGAPSVLVRADPTGYTQSPAKYKGGWDAESGTRPAGRAPRPSLLYDVPAPTCVHSWGLGGARAGLRFSRLSIAHRLSFHLRCPGLSPSAKARPTGPGGGHRVWGLSPPPTFLPLFKQPQLLPPTRGAAGCSARVC